MTLTLSEERAEQLRADIRDRMDERAELRKKLRENGKQIKRLRAMVGRARLRKDGTRKQDVPVRIAGPANVARVKEILQEAPGRRLTYKEITRQLGRSSGTVTYALRALADDGLVEPTGEKVNGSREYRLVTRRVARRRSA